MKKHIDFHSQKEEQTRKLNACITAVEGSELNLKDAIIKIFEDVKGLVAKTRDFVTEKLEGLHFEHSKLELAAKVSIPASEVVNVVSAIIAEEKNPDNNIIFTNTNEKLAPEHVADLNQASELLCGALEQAIDLINGKVNSGKEDDLTAVEEALKNQGEVAPPPAEDDKVVKFKDEIPPTPPVVEPQSGTSENPPVKEEIKGKKKDS